MKFGLQLNESLVPEWRLQYLDYKAGKKQVKKLAKKNKGPDDIEAQPQQSRYDGSSANHLVLAHPTAPAPAPAEQVSSHTTTARSRVTAGQLLASSPAIDQNDKSINGASRSSSDRYGSTSSEPTHLEPTSTLSTPYLEQLPPPAMHVDSNTSISVPASSSRNKKIDDKSPLLQSGTTSQQVNLPPRRDSDSISPLFKNVLSRTLTGRLRIGSIYPASSPRNDVFAMDTFQEDDGEAEFSKWVDGEFERIQKFYREKEEEAVERYLILQDQLVRLKESKMRLKMKTAAKLRKRKALGIKSVTKSGFEKLRKKVDLPSLPNLAVGREEKKRQQRDIQTQFEGVSEPADNRPHASPRIGTGNQGPPRDYVRKNQDDDVSYYAARRELKSAISEYYRSLELLKSYRMLNRTAIRKILKKFDKAYGGSLMPKYMEKLERTYFARSDVLDQLLTKTEDLYARYFENGNRKHAVEKLRAKEHPDEHYSSMFITGLFLGLALPLFIQAIARGISKLHTEADTAFLFQIWGGFFLVILFLCLFVINCYVWTVYKINYPFIFEFDTRDFLDYRQLGEIPSFLLFLLSLFGWLCFSDYWPDTFAPIYYPPIFLGIAVVIFIAPVPILHWSARKWVLRAVGRLVLSGLYPVEFRDFFLGDIFCSLTYSLSNMSLFFCLYATYWSNILPGSLNGSSCGSSRSRILGFLNTLPGIWRLLQCFRRYADTGDWFPHLANLGKYSSTVLYYVFLSTYRIDRTSQANRSLFIVFASINSIYSSFWDLFMDWSLLQQSENFLLRNELGFKTKWPYYCAMIIDPILRFNWIFYAIYANQIEQSAKVSFFIALTELLRRFMWIFFRVENEHCANVARLRASRDLNLPFEIATKVKHESTSHPTIAENDESIDPLAQVDSLQADATAPDESPVSSVRRSPRSVRIMTPADSPQSSKKLSRRPTLAAIATPMLQAMKTAHARDFERRKVKPEDTHDDNESDDDDDDDDDMSIASDVEGADSPRLGRSRDTSRAEHWSPLN